MTEQLPGGGPAPRGGAAPELVDSGFYLENADAPFLHHGLNLADMAHVLDLRRRHLVPDDAARTLLGLLLEAEDIAAEDFPYDPSFGEPYNSREAHFVSRVGDIAGWLHAGRPRREAVRIALRLHVRHQIAELAAEASRFASVVADRSQEHADTVMPDQTYLQQAQPSTFGHYLLSFAYPALRDARRLLDELDEIDCSPGGAGCVNGTRLLDDRTMIAELLGFSGIIEHTRDAMWQVDGFVHVLATAASLVSTLSKLAEDLEIWASAEFDFVDLADGFTRASVLMPQKRNPYSLAIIRGACGVLIGRISGFLAVAKSPSARSDNLIYAYGEVPRALDLALRIARLATGVVGSLRVNADRMVEEVNRGYSQATDLAEYLVQTCHIDYRSAYLVVGRAVQVASRDGVGGTAITGERVDEAARQQLGRSLGMIGSDLSQVLDPWQIVLSRSARGGAAPDEVSRMIDGLRKQATDLNTAADGRLAAFNRTDRSLLQAAKAAATPVAGDPSPALRKENP